MSSSSTMKRSVDRNLNNKSKLVVSAEIAELQSRLETLEKKHDAFFDSVRKTFIDLGKNQQQLNSVLEAIVKIVGAEQVGKTMSDIKHESLEAEAAKMDVVVQEGLSNGDLAPIEVVNESCWLVLNQRDKDGNEKFPRRLHVLWPHLVDEVKALVNGAKKGEKFTLQDGDTIEVLEIYGTIEKKESAAQ